MKTNLIKIYKSASGDMTHYIYRNQSQPIEKDLEEFINSRTPVGVVSEIDDTKLTSIEELKNVSMLVNKSPKNYEGYISFSLPFNFNIPNSVYYIKFRNSVDSKNDDIVYKIYIGANVVTHVQQLDEKDNVLNDITNINALSKNFILLNNSILFNNDLDLNYKSITFTGSLKVYNFYDVGKNFSDIRPQRGHGIYKPVIRTINTTDYMSFYQDADYRKNSYYYYVISKDNNRNISDISNTAVLEISETNLEFALSASSDYYYTENPTFDEVLGTATSIDEIRVNKEKLVCSIVPIEGISIYASDLDEDGSRIIRITNIWNSDNRKFMLRNKKVLKGSNSCFDEDSIKISVESDPFIFDDTKEEVLIDKIEVLKKDVTVLSEDERKNPIQYKDSAGKVLKVFVRKGGVYYQEYFIKNKDIPTNDYDYPTYLVSSITLNSRFPNLKINDTGIRGNKYNYTVYLYDKYKKISKAIVSVV